MHHISNIIESAQISEPRTRIVFPTGVSACVMERVVDVVWEQRLDVARMLGEVVHCTKKGRYENLREIDLKSD